MNSYRYRFETYKGSSTRYRCPKCKQKSFVRYLDVQTGEHISPKVGRCNRESKCGYHYSPKQYFADNDYRLPIKTQHVIPNGVRTVSSPSYVIPSLSRNLLNSGSTLSEEMSRSARHDEKSPSYIPIQAFSSSLRNYSDNHFVQYLHTLFNADTVSNLIKTYHIGTSKHWKGATVFWQVDKEGSIRTGKVMHYNPVTGKRVKQPYSHITWAHKLLNKPDFNLKQCLFGEHLLRGGDKTCRHCRERKNGDYRQRLPA
jgi:hypothetical protein